MTEPESPEAIAPVVPSADQSPTWGTPGYPAPGYPSPGYPAPGYPAAGYPPPPSPDLGRAQRLVRICVSVVLAVLVLAYGAAVLFTRDAWRSGEPRSATTAVFTVRADPDTPITPELLTQTRDGLQRRVESVGGRDITATVDGDDIRVRAVGVSAARLGGISGVGRLNIRPVIHVLPARPDPAYRSRSQSGAAQPTADLAERIAAEKELRQNTNPQIQLLALQVQATRCDQPDVLAGHDDPTRPLVTCSTDHKQVYLLAKSIVGGDQVKDATSGFDRERGEYVVGLRFDEDAADTWANFTAANIGSQTAFVIDTQVVSAPAIQEAIPSGRTQITGHFTADTASSLAAALVSRPLPLAAEVKSTQVERLEPKFWTVPRFAVAGGGIAVLFAVVAGLLVLRPRTAR